MSNPSANVCQEEMIQSSIVALEGRLSAGFERQCFKAIIADFRQSSSPLRLTYLALGIRELMRNILERIAPDVEVTDCGWRQTSVGEPQRVTRAERLRYAVHGGLSASFFDNDTQEEIIESIREITDTIGSMNKYAHFTEKVFSPIETDVSKALRNYLYAFSSVFDMIDRVRADVVSKVGDKLHETVSSVIISTVMEDVDILSTHSTVTDVDISEVEVIAITSSAIRIQGTGSVDCRLQYGSNSDLKSGLGAVSGDSFPMSFSCSSSVETPFSILVEVSDIKIDTSSWWE